MSDDTGTRRLQLLTADGLELEADVADVADVAEPTGAPLGEQHVPAAVVLAHPHPLHGGSMQSIVTSELFRLLPARGMVTMRFNFRGVGASGGEHGHGEDERLDVEAAVETLAGLTDVRPLVLCGWSFGADVSLSVVDPRLAAWVAIAPPLRFRPAADYGAVGGDARPKLVIVPEHDEFRSPASATEATREWTNSRLEVVPGADHFLIGRTDKAARLIADFIAGLD